MSAKINCGCVDPGLCLCGLRQEVTKKSFVTGGHATGGQCISKYDLYL